MNQTVANKLIEQVKDVLNDFQSLKSRTRYDDLSDMPGNELYKFLSRAAAVISKLPSANNPYASQEASIHKSQPSIYFRVLSVAGVLEGLCDDLKAGYVKTLTEMVHGEVFSEYLEMAEHLIENKYKDPAAVITGSTLEVHLRELCKKYNIKTVVSTKKGVAQMKADTMNAELCKASAYGKLDLKNVTAWIDLRNKAAHGEYIEYNDQQVKLMIENVRNFMARVPA